MKTPKRIMGVLLATATLAVLPVASADAAPFSMSIDNAVMDLGGLSGVRAIDSDPEPPATPDPPATMSGDLSGSNVSIPKASFVFPTKSAEVSAGITANIDMEANQDIVGTFDAASGALSLDVSLKATVGVMGSTCVISPIAMTLSSENARPYIGEAFTSGIEGQGVISASWTGLPPVTGGGSCGVVAGLIAGPGGIAMSHGVRDFKTCATHPSEPLCSVPIPPEKAPRLNSAPSSSTDSTTATFAFEKGAGETQEVTGFECKLDSGEFEACTSPKEYTDLGEGPHSFEVRAKNDVGVGPETPHSWTVTKKVGPEGKARFGALKAKAKPAKVKRGKKTTVTVKVKNVGDAAAAGVKVCVAAPKKLVSVKKCVNKGALPVGATASLKFKVTVKKKAKKGKKASLKFTATGNGLKAVRGSTAIKVK